jgi:hypothetical protein
MKMKYTLVILVCLLAITGVLASEQMEQRSCSTDGDEACGGGGPSGPYCGSLYTSYEYNDRNWVTSITYHNLKTARANPAQFDWWDFKEEYVYDTPTGTPTVGNLYSLREKETQLHIYLGEPPTTVKVDKKVNFGYDNLNRLTSATPDTSVGAPGTTQRLGRYLDTLQFGYDAVGNIKNNYELTYCYEQVGGTDTCEKNGAPVVCACGSGITTVTNNRLLKVKAGPTGYGLDTLFGYDTYGNLCYEKSYQEVPVGAISSYHPGNEVRVLFADLPKSVSGMRVLFYHMANGIFTASENVAWQNLQSTEYTCGANCQESPYWDENPKYTSYVSLLKDIPPTGNEMPGRTLTDPTDFYGPDAYYKTYNGQPIPFIKQYFRAYRDMRTNYKWDYANRLLSSWECSGTAPTNSCMVFTYDHAGNRISKIVKGASASSSGPASMTKYITQGNNVIYEDNSDLTSYTCPYVTCPSTSTCAT